MSAARSSGFTLIEALVALVILSVGMLGMAGLYVVTLQSGGTAIYRTQAVNLAADMADRIRANRLATTGVTTGYGAAGANHNCTGAAATTDCSAADLAADDIFSWSAQVANTLPSGVGAVVVLNAATTPVSYQISITWKEPSQPTAITYTLNTQI